MEGSAVSENPNSRWDSQNPSLFGLARSGVGLCAEGRMVRWRYETFKKLVRVVGKVVGCAAGAVFLIAPVTSLNGFVWMAGSAYVGLMCIFAHRWADPDEGPGAD